MIEKIKTIVEYFLSGLLILMSAVAIAQLTRGWLALISALGAADVAIDLYRLKQPFGLLTIGFLGSIACVIGHRHPLFTVTVFFLQGHFFNAQCALQTNETESVNKNNAPPPQVAPTGVTPVDNSVAPETTLHNNNVNNVNNVVKKLTASRRLGV